MTYSEARVKLENGYEALATWTHGGPVKLSIGGSSVAAHRASLKGWMVKRRLWLDPGFRDFISDADRDAIQAALLAAPSKTE